MADSESSSQANTAQTDNRRVLGEGALSAENSTINQTSTVYNTTLDAGVASKAFDFGGNALDAVTRNSTASLRDSLDFAQAALGKSFDFSRVNSKQALDSLDKTSNLVKDAYEDAKGRGALTDKILIGAIAMAGLVAFAAVRK